MTKVICSSFNPREIMQTYNCIQKKMAGLALLALALIGSCQVDEPEETSYSNPLYNKKPSTYYYVYDSTKKEIDNFFGGFADTFSINGNRFRMRCDPDPSGELIMEVMVNGKWETNFKSYYGVMGCNRKGDVNLDGYPDFSFFNFKDFNTNLYNPKINRFEKYCVTLGITEELLDSTKNIFYDLYWKDVDFIRSAVFTFKDLNLYYYYSLREMPGLPGDNNFRLYACRNGKLKDTLFLRDLRLTEPVNTENFGLYWKQLILTY